MISNNNVFIYEPNKSGEEFKPSLVPSCQIEIRVDNCGYIQIDGAKGKFIAPNIIEVIKE